MRKLTIFSLGICLILSQNIQAQYFKRPFNAATNYNTYTRQMDEYYSNNDRGRGTGFKQYMRWRHEMDLKVGRNGLVQNFSKLNNDAFANTFAKIQKKGAKVQSNGLWEDLGPHDYYTSDSYSNSGLGRVNCMAFHPTNTNIFWAGTPAGGLWKTTNGGLNWTCISNQFASIGISDIAVNYLNPNIIYILTGDVDGGDSFSIGVLKTSDGGLTWKKTGLSFDASQAITGFALRMHPVDPNILLVGLQQPGIAPFATCRISTDGANTWANKIFDIAVTDIEFKPGNPAIIYASTINGLMKSTNTGGTFTPAGAGLPSLGVRTHIAISPSAPNNLYFIHAGVPAVNQFNGLYKSTNSGDNFNLQSNSPNIYGRHASGNDNQDQSGYDLGMVVDPTTDARVIVGSINCWKTDNSGSTWSRETWGDRSFGAVDPFVHNDFHNVYYNGGRLYAVTDGGIVYSLDQGNSWTEISAGLGNMQFYKIDVHNDSYIGGTQDNGCNGTTFGNMQTHNLLGGDGFGVAWHTGDRSIQFLSSQSGIIRRQFGTNLEIYNGSNAFWFTELSMSKSTPEHLWCINLSAPTGTFAGRNLMRGNQVSILAWDWGWQNTNTAAFLTNGIRGYAQGTNNTEVMYVVSTNEIIRSANVNTIPSTWVVKTNPFPAGLISNVEVDPANANRVWVTYSGYNAGNKVFRSIDGGNTWTNVSGTLPNVPIRCLVYDSPGSDKIYLGTEIGVFYKSGTMPDWEYFSNNLPNVPVNDLKIMGTYLYAGTFGRGIWRSPINTACPPTLTLTPANETNLNIYAPGTQVHAASVSLTSTRVYPGSVGTNIYYHGGTLVDLKEGFEIKTDAYMEVKNKGCPE